jgi:hypothetical protein
MGLGINRGKLTCHHLSEVREKSWLVLDSNGLYKGVVSLIEPRVGQVKATDETSTV